MKKLLLTMMSGLLLMSCTTTSKGFVSVNARTGEIEPIGLEGCPCPFKNPCICPEEKLSDGDDPYIMVWIKISNIKVTAEAEL
jgi:hypothetical protein